MLARIRPVVAVALIAATANAQQFFHFESPHVHPLELTSDAKTLLAVNTVDARLEVFSVLNALPHLRHVRSIPVGLEPVTVRMRTAEEAWVVNHVSDSITVVDVAAGRVLRTILTDDEPCDVVFAGTPQRAFVTLSQRNKIAVYDAADPMSEPTVLSIAGEDPRALVTDGVTVYAAIFECGNDTTIIDASVVSGPLNPYPGDPNPPPNSLTAPSGFSPALNPALPAAPQVSQIVRKNSTGKWLDESGFDWSAAVGWDLHGNDVAAIDVQSLGVSYFSGFMTTPMALALRPNGDLVAVGTEALNHIRFEPNLNGVFLRVEAAVRTSGSGAITRFDLNPQLDYTVSLVDPDMRALGLGDPRGVAISGDGSVAYVTGMGSSNVAAIDLASGARLALGNAGDGPTGIVLDEPNNRLFTLNRFDGSISVLKTDSLGELATVRYFDPTPAPLKNGRPFLYDTHVSSGLGITSCASCHVDARMDQLAWDLGDPSGQMKPFDQSCDFAPTGQNAACGDWHPMKGPMVTQTLLGLEGDAPFHWRGDRANLAEFGHAANSLLGNESDFSAKEMARLETYLSSISRMPNPNRNLDGTLSTSVGSANAVLGRDIFLNGGIVAGANCTFCHNNPKGGNASVLDAAFAQQLQSVKIAHLTNLHEKTGFDKSSQSNNRGFGFEHDGALGTMVEFLSNPVFTGFVIGGNASQRKDVAAFMFSFDESTHAAVGAQVTLTGDMAGLEVRRAQLMAIAGTGAVDMLVRTSSAAGSRSYALVSAGSDGTAHFQSDVLAEGASLAELDALAAKGVAVTYTVVPAGTAMSLLDRDHDGFLDGDEIAGCSDPANPQKTPVGTCRFDIAGDDGQIDGQDLAVLLNAWGTDDPVANVNCEGPVDGADLAEILNAWGQCQ